mmetsp:Transcript_118118/g.294535  ORF Transcript_118118/g.294535 Transcript_118118/m.294535 type:complete len:212 (-) Transcript_118118:2466-3101(-)
MGGTNCCRLALSGCTGAPGDLSSTSSSGGSGASTSSRTLAGWIGATGKLSAQRTASSMAGGATGPEASTQAPGVEASVVTTCSVGCRLARGSEEMSQETATLSTDSPIVGASSVACRCHVVGTSGSALLWTGFWDEFWGGCTGDTASAGGPSGALTASPPERGGMTRHLLVTSLANSNRSMSLWAVAIVVNNVWRTSNMSDLSSFSSLGGG